MLQEREWSKVLVGGALALVGVGLVEMLLFVGAEPIAPIGWPSLGAVAAAAIAGLSGLLGGAIVVLAYYLACLPHPERFPDFFGNTTVSISWAIAIAMLAAAALGVRPRLLRLATAEGELAVRRKYETALRETEERVRIEKERLEMALDGSNVVLWDADFATGRVHLTEAWSCIIGAAEGETLTTMPELLALVHPDDLAPVRRAVIETLKGGCSSYAVEHRVRATSGEWHWVISRGRVTERDASGRALRAIGTNVDITDRKRIEEAVHSAAQSDPLTGLANRSAFDERLRLALGRSRSAGTDIAVLYLDLDDFKRVNDTLGHAAGDRVLKDVALRVRSCVRSSDTVARRGGDEFVVLLEDLRERHHAITVVEKIVEEMRRPVRLDGREVAVTASAGLAYAHAGTDGDSLLKRADEALYKAKAAGRNRYSLA